MGLKDAQDEAKLLSYFNACRFRRSKLLQDSLLYAVYACFLFPGAQKNKPNLVQIVLSLQQTDKDRRNR